MLTGDLLGVAQCGSFDSNHFDVVIHVERLSGASARAMSYRKSDRQKHPSSLSSHPSSLSSGASGERFFDRTSRRGGAAPFVLIGFRRGRPSGPFKTFF